LVKFSRDGLEEKPTVVSRCAAEETIINSTYGIVKDAFEIEYGKRRELAEMKAAGSRF